LGPKDSDTFTAPARVSTYSQQGPFKGDYGRRIVSAWWTHLLGLKVRVDTSPKDGRGKYATQAGFVKSRARLRGVEKDRPVEIGILNAAGYATHVKYPGAAIAKSNSTGSV
jgi:hypothetical protein